MMTATEAELLATDIQKLALRCAPAPLAPEKVAAYVEDLADLPYPAVRDVLLGMRKTQTFFPTVAEIRTAAANAAGLPSPEQAWALVMSRWKATTPGLPAPPWEVHPAVLQATRDAGGMYLLRQMEREKAERAFLSAYKPLRSAALGASDPALGAGVLVELGAGR